MKKWQLSFVVALMSSTICWADYYSTSFEAANGFIDGQTIIGKDGWSRMSYGLDSQPLVTTVSAAVTQGIQALAITANTDLKIYHALTTNNSPISATFQVSADVGYDSSTCAGGSIGIFNKASEWGGIWFGLKKDGETMKFQYKNGTTWYTVPLESGQTDPVAGTMYRFVALIYPATASYDLNVYTMSGTLVGKVTGAQGRYSWEHSFDSIGFQVSGTAGKIYVDNPRIDPEPITVWPGYYSTSFESKAGFVEGQTIIGKDGWLRMSYGLDSQALIIATSPAVTQGLKALSIAATTSLKVYHPITPTNSQVGSTFQVSADIGWDAANFTSGLIRVFNNSSEWGGVLAGIRNDNGTMKFQYLNGSTWTSVTLESGQTNPVKGTMYHCVLLVHPASCSFDWNIYTMSGTLVGSVTGVNSRYTWETSFNSVGFQVDGSAGKFYVDKLQISPEPAMVFDLLAGGGAIVVDGNIDEWNTADWIAMDEKYDGNPTDIGQAFYSARWSPATNKIYVAVKVQDTAHCFTSDYNTWASRDAVELYIHAAGTGDGTYQTNQDVAQQWVVGIKSGTVNEVWTSLSSTKSVPNLSGFTAAGKVDGDWIYYEAEMTPFDYFGGLTSQANVISTLEPDQQIGLDVCVISNNGSSVAGPYGIVGYTGTKCENTRSGKFNNWTTFALHTVQVALAGDANDDTSVDVGDLGILAANYGGTGKNWSQGDFNGDGLVDVGDLGILAANYGSGSVQAMNFSADYAKIFGSTAESSNNEAVADTSSSVCSGLGLPLIAGVLLAGLMLVKLEE